MLEVGARPFEAYAGDPAGSPAAPSPLSSSNPSPTSTGGTDGGREWVEGGSAGVARDLGAVVGHLVLYPLLFLADEDLEPSTFSVANVAPDIFL